MLTHSFAVVLTALTLFGVAAPVRSQGKADSVKVVIHVNFADADQQQRGLKNIENILKAVKEAEVLVVCHGPGINLVVKDQSKHGDAVRALVKKGVKFVACENTMREKLLNKDQLLPDTGTVASGALEVIRRQQAGYAYFKP